MLNTLTSEEENVAIAQGKEVISIGLSSKSIINAMRSSFYNIYSEHFECVKEGGTSVMTKASYDEMVQLLVDSERYKGQTKPMEIKVEVKINFVHNLQTYAVLRKRRRMYQKKKLHNKNPHQCNPHSCCHMYKNKVH